MIEAILRLTFIDWSLFFTALWMIVVIGWVQVRGIFAIIAFRFFPAFFAAMYLVVFWLHLLGGGNV